MQWPCPKGWFPLPMVHWLPLKIQRKEIMAQAERLSVADKRRVEGARAGAAHDYYSQFPFQPAINERSRHLVKVKAQPPYSICYSICGAPTGGRWYNY